MSNNDYYGERKVVTNSGSFYISIPIKLVKELGLNKGDFLRIAKDNNEIKMKKASY